MSSPAPLELAALIGFLAGAEAGDLTGALGDDPCVVVDLDSPEPGAVPRVPGALPAVVVGISRTGAPHADPRLVDVALTTEARGRPWVQVADLEAAAVSLTDAVATCPLASVVLTQALRRGRASIEGDLLLESLAYSTLQAGPEFAAWLRSRPGQAPRAQTGDPVVVTRHNDEVTITLDQPDRHNALSAALRDRLYEALAFVAAAPDVSTLHLRGNGRSFCSGGDLREFGTTPDPAVAHLIRTSRSCGRLLAALAERATVHVHGDCIGAGTELAAFVGQVVAHPDTRFRLPEVSMGLIPGAGGTVSVPRRIGRHRTAWLALTGADIGAPTAHSWGLVDRISPPLCNG